MILRQLPAATARSLALISTCTSFSASAKVDGDTSGPTAGAVPKAGGAPGGKSAGFCARLEYAAAAPSTPRDVTAKNCLRDFDMFLISSEPHCSFCKRRARLLRLDCFGFHPKAKRPGQSQGVCGRAVAS